MGKESNKGRVTPSMVKKKATQRRNQRHAKRTDQVKKPSWSEALKRKYIEADEKESGKRVPAKAWGDRKNKRVRTDVEDDDINSDDEDYLKGEIDGMGGKRKGHRLEHDDGIEIQDDVDEEKQERLNQRTSLATQLFLKGLPTDTEEDAIKREMGRFGEVLKVFIVTNRMTKHPTGTAFVHFKTEEEVSSAHDHAVQNAREVAADDRHANADRTNGLSNHKAKQMMHKMRQDKVASKEPFILIGGTRVTVFKAISKTDSQELTGEMHKGGKKGKTLTGNEDPRNLYLLAEGVIREGDPAATGLHPRYVAMLEGDYEQKKQQLKNVNYFVSKTRLSVRNIPRKLETKDLRALFLKHTREYLQAHKEDKEKKKWGKWGPIKQIRILSDSKGQSKGFGFVEFINHNVALAMLRNLNNNPDIYGPSRRLVVGFAVENTNAIQKMDRLKELRSNRSIQGKQGFYD
jgi:nucleolar protein 4